MTFHHLAKLFLKWGFFIQPKEYDNFKKYLEEMLAKRRVILFKDNDTIKAIITYFLTDNWEDYLWKGLWEVKPDNPNGSQIFIDKMVCQSWNLPMRRYLQNSLEETFNVSEIHYYHAPYGPHVRIKRRRPFNVL